MVSALVVMVERIHRDCKGLQHAPTSMRDLH